MTDRQYYFWRIHPDIIKLKTDLSRRWFADDIPDILEAMKREAIKGDTNAAKVFLEYVSEWRTEDEKDKVPVVINKNTLNIYIKELRSKDL
ncbi:hypothetical protein KAU51_03955 [Candidatus Parcubacteria bacterium]|nr:hypothetical protein [Candidatus Parcubacteria bacterium]